MEDHDHNHMHVDYEFDLDTPQAGWWDPAMIDDSMLVEAMVVTAMGWTLQNVTEDGVASEDELGVLIALHGTRSGRQQCETAVVNIDYGSLYILIHALIRNMPDDVQRRVVHSLAGEYMKQSMGNLPPSPEVQAAMTAELAVKIREQTSRPTAQDERDRAEGDPA